MSETKRAKRMLLSASRVKQFHECSWLFYQTYFLKVPDTTHPKTKLGTLAHAILEALCKPKHKRHYDAVVHHQSVYASPAITRMIQMFRAANPDLTDTIIADLDACVFVALNHDFNCVGAKRVLPPEHAFTIDFGDFSIKGFMDRVILYDDHAVIRDYKTQGKRFTESQIAENIQAFFYQTAVMHEFGLPARVEFLLLRFPPNKRDPSRYLQIVESLSREQIEGFKACLSHANEALETLTEEQSQENLKASSDEGFCLRVCSLREPLDYWVLLEGEKIAKGSRTPLEPKPGQIVVKRRYNGCPAFYNSKTGARRSFQ